ncbi:MAG TPA: pyruvate dehydrogenase complex dihydrolipoamide acetyltransferase [Thermomicrobiales bacterium]|nr:pyruvate dehydrogenase complex dihydrolipoamide acetyltransferase [Thermomicrobiales bacterium]
MAKTVVMPQMGYDMDAGTLLRWLKQEGDAVERGEAIAEIETDKVNIEIEAFEGGILRKTLITEGQTVPVGDPIAIIGTADEPIEGVDAKAAPAKPAAEAPVAAAPEPAAAPAESPVEAAQQGSTATANGAAEPARAPVAAQATSAPSPQPATLADGERVRASPLVRRIAAEHEIDLMQVAGTGPHGRIVKRDIEDFMTGAKPKPQAQPAAASAAAEVEEERAQAPAAAPRPAATGELVDLPRIRQTIGKRMSQSFQQAPHFYVSMSIGMDKAMDLREQINAGVDKETQISVNDLIVKASALALRDFPVLNSAWADGKMQTHSTIDVGIAIAIEGGLISPFIPEADHKSLGAIARMTKDLATRARNGKLTPEEYQGGTFTTSNLGMFGVDEFIAIINPPQASILAIGGIKHQPVWDDESGEFKPRQLMKVTMSADHRLTDGAEVARYLQALKQTLESPMKMLLG